MCGIVGFIGGDPALWAGRAETFVRAMGKPINHRGPDHSGAWIDAERRIALGHKRLAIVDLSPAGEQPMRSPSGRYVIVYNGEIYNHLDLRQELAQGGSIAWRGHSDTETLLAAVEAWGLAGALEKCVGMFAFALWDRQEGALFLARDRLGEKPLYYGWQGQARNAAFIFGSELKALAAHPAFAGEIDRDALTAYVRHGYVPSPRSIYKGISKLDPGCFLRLATEDSKPSIHQYWSAVEAAERGVANPISVGPDEAVDELERLLGRAVSQQMIADVPLGAFLSGGVDSSTVVALMQAQSSRRVRTFSIGFEEEEYNEARHAEAVAQHLGTDHTELYVTPQDAISVIPSLPTMYDEPFADSSQIPTFLVSQLARRHVTVSLSGDAGDELFGGYNRYSLSQLLWRRLQKVPLGIRSVAAGALTSVSPSAWNRIAASAHPILPNAARVRLPGDKIHKGAEVLRSRNASELYRGLVSIWRDPSALVIDGMEPSSPLADQRLGKNSLSDVERMMALDLVTYLPDDILAKVDRAAMSVSLETRVPMLDHRVVEFAWRMPLEFKLRDGVTKWALRQVLYRHVPRHLIERPKMGFGIPIGDWLRGPLRGWAEELLNPARLMQEGYFRPTAIQQMWKAHLSGQVNEQYRLWVILMFQAWLEHQSSSTSVLPLRSPMPAVA